jgi:hypothetical protein
MVLSTKAEKHNNNLRIAVSGRAGSGKSALADSWGQALLRRIARFVRILLGLRIALHGGYKESIKDLPTIARYPFGTQPAAKGAEKHL